MRRTNSNYPAATTSGPSTNNGLAIETHTSRRRMRGNRDASAVQRAVHRRNAPTTDSQNVRYPIRHLLFKMDVKKSEKGVFVPIVF